MIARAVAWLALLLAAASVSNAAQISAARVVVAEDHTRIVLESDAPIRFSLLALRNPERLVLDLEGVEAEAVTRALAGRIEAGHAYVGMPRIGKAPGGGVRVEFDLKAAAEPRIHASSPGAGGRHELTLDIYPAGAIRLARPTSVLPRPARPEDEEMLLAVQLNRQTVPETIVAVKRADGRVLVRDEDLRRWRFRLPAGTPIAHGAETYYALDAMPGLAYRIDEASLTLHVDAPATIFSATALAGDAGSFSTPPPAPPGAFANYDVFTSHSKDSNVTSGQFEVGAFNAWGAGIGTFLGRSSGTGPRWVRLETTFTHDLPSSVASLRVGDAIGATGSWGRAVRFGGVQFATNFATQPTFITFPLPGLAGEATLPSTVDLYVNDALRLRREVPSGPFSIQDLPIVTGSGQMRLVVRDVLGRERVIVQPFYATARLLREGLHEYAYEAGFVREDFTFRSNEYGRGVATATHRYGFTDHLTGEVRAEVLRDQQTAGAGGAVLWDDVGVFTASLAGSRRREGSGGLAALGFEHQALRWSVGANTQLASERFVQLGLQPGEIAARRRNRAYLSYATPRYGSVALSYTHQDYRDRDDVELLGLSYSISLGRRFGFLSFSVLRFLGGDAKTVLGLNYSLSLDARTSLSASANGERGSHQAQVQVQRNLPPGTGYGYRVLAATGDTDRIEAGLGAQNDYGTYLVEAARARGDTAYRASVSGGVAFMGLRPFPSRRIDASFAVVEVPGYPDVRVYSANQLVATTDAAGTALIPRLLPYQKNPVRIEQADLPLDAQVDAVQVDAVPNFRSGMRLPFPIKRSRGGVLTIILDGGAPMPAGALVRLADGTEEFPVGLRGEVYVSGLGATNRLRATWRGQACEIDVAFPQTTDPLPHLGTHTCKGVAR